MTRERIYLFDTTLRDGQQTPGIDFSVEDKIAIASMLDEFGLDYVEGGYPGANPTDTAFFSEKRTTQARFVAFGMTKRAGISASNDPGLASLLQAKSDAICFVAKSWDYHVKVALGCTNEENLECIAESVKAAVEAGKRFERARVFDPSLEILIHQVVERVLVEDVAVVPLQRTGGHHLPLRA